MERWVLFEHILREICKKFYVHMKQMLKKFEKYLIKIWKRYRNTKNCWENCRPCIIHISLVASQITNKLPICKILHCEDSQNRHGVKFASPELNSTHFSQPWKLWLTCEDRDGFMMQHLCDMFAPWRWMPTFLRHMNVMYDNLT